jgi:hypothetical protein
MCHKNTHKKIKAQNKIKDYDSTFFPEFEVEFPSIVPSPRLLDEPSVAIKLSLSHLLQQEQLETQTANIMTMSQQTG